MQNGISTGEPYVSVDVHSLSEAGAVVARLGVSLSGASTLAEREVQAGLASVADERGRSILARPD